MWSVRQARQDDAQGMLAVQRKAFQRNQRKYEARLPQMQETLDHLRQEIDDGRALVARQSGQVVGHARYRVLGDKECEVYNLSVDPAFSHMEVGRSLMTQVETVAQEAHDCRRLIAETGLRDSEAIEFYLALAYRPITLIPDDDTRLDRVRFVKQFS